MAALTAKASFKKENGALSISKTHLLWTPATRASGVIEESLDKIAALFSSPPASGKHNLKVTFTPPSSHPAGVTFLFTDPTSAPADQAAFKQHLSTIASQNKARLTMSAAPSPAAVGGSPSTVGSGSGAPSPAPGPSSATDKGKGRAVQTNGGLDGLVGKNGKSVLEDWNLHKRVLVKNGQLAKLHLDLVQNGDLTDAEFWQGRELLLLSEAASSNQSAGRSSQLIDDRWSVKDAKGKGKDGASSSGGGSASGTISLTPDLIRDIFEEFPEVQEAYHENVTTLETCDPSSFWTRYFNSRLWERHRASARSSKLGSAKADEMFDKYLEAPDDGLEPRHNPASVLNRFLDLAATEEDHNGSGNAEDVTMQAGRERASLPLMRRFNEHSEKLLRATQNRDPADEPSAKRPKLETSKSRDEERLAELDLDDLHSAGASKEVPLDMDVQDRQKYFEGRSAGEETAKAAQRDEAETAAILDESRASFRGWKPQLEDLRLDKRTAEEAMLGLTSSVKARVDAKTTKDDIPSDVLKQMISTHTATCEFLRQFWSAILPTPPSSVGNVLASSSPAEKSAKAAKMVRYLGGTAEKADAVIAAAIAGGSDGEKVRIALKPTLDSVEKALFFYHSRKK